MEKCILMVGAVNEQHVAPKDVMMQLGDEG